MDERFLVLGSLRMKPPLAQHKGGPREGPAEVPCCQGDSPQGRVRLVFLAVLEGVAICPPPACPVALRSPTEQDGQGVFFDGLSLILLISGLVEPQLAFILFCSLDAPSGGSWSLSLGTGFPQFEDLG